MAFLLAPIPIAVAVGSSIVTGVASYFWFKKGDDIHSENIDSRGEINNNIKLAIENNTQNNMLVSLVAILVLLKVCELIIYIFKAHQRSVKRKYMNRNILQLNNQPINAQLPAQGV